MKIIKVLKKQSKTCLNRVELLVFLNCFISSYSSESNKSNFPFANPNNFAVYAVSNFTILNPVARVPKLLTSNGTEKDRFVTT